MCLLQSLSIPVEDILKKGSAREETTLPMKPKEASRTALSALSIQHTPARASLAELCFRALERRNCLEDYVALCRTEPVFLTHVVNSWFYSRPDLVPAVDGCIKPLATDKYISVAFFEVLQKSILALAIWDYIYQLLREMETKLDNRRRRAIILQELANVCHFEHRRAQSLFRRFAQSGSASKYFRRASLHGSES
ncbi:hypothetical protein BJX64DRAFT_252159 [Aspergillus heterothallicus]